MFPEIPQTRARATSVAPTPGIHPVGCACGCGARSGVSDLAADPRDLMELAALWRLDAATLATVLAAPGREHEDLASLVAALAVAAGRGDAAALGATVRPASHRALQRLLQDLPAAGIVVRLAEPAPTPGASR